MHARTPDKTCLLLSTPLDRYSTRPRCVHAQAPETHLLFCIPTTTTHCSPLPTSGLQDELDAEDVVGGANAASTQDRWLAEAGMILRDPPTMHMLAAEVVVILYR